MSNVIVIKKLMFFFLIFMINICQGQVCKDFHKSENCYVYTPLDREYKIYNQAKSAQVEIMKPVTYKIILFGGKDYIVGVCAEGNYYRKIHFRIIDGITKTVLYDNKDMGYIESFDFSVDKTKPIEMEVTVLSDDKAAENKNVCVGFQVLYSNTVASN